MSTPELAGVDGVERVLGVDERGHAAAALGLGDHVQGERRLARGLRAVDLDHAAARHPADAERGVERQRAGGDGGDVDLLPAAEPHDRALAELLVDLGEGGLDRLAPLLLVVSHRPSPSSFPGERSGSSRRVERSLARKAVPRVRLDQKAKKKRLSSYGVDQRCCQGCVTQARWTSGRLQ